MRYHSDLSARGSSNGGLPEYLLDTGTDSELDDYEIVRAPRTFPDDGDSASLGGGSAISDNGSEYQDEGLPGKAHRHVSNQDERPDAAGSLDGSSGGGAGGSVDGRDDQTDEMIYAQIKEKQEEADALRAEGVQQRAVLAALKVEHTLYIAMQQRQSPTSRAASTVPRSDSADLLRQATSLASTSGSASDSGSGGASPRQSRSQSSSPVPSGSHGNDSSSSSSPDVLSDTGTAADAGNIGGSSSGGSGGNIGGADGKGSAASPFPRPASPLISGDTPPGSPLWPADSTGSIDGAGTGTSTAGSSSSSSSSTNINVQRARALQALVDTLQMQRTEAESGTGKAAVQRVVDEAAQNNQRLSDAWGESLKMENELLAIRNMWMNEFGDTEFDVQKLASDSSAPSLPPAPIYSVVVFFGVWLIRVNLIGLRTVPRHVTVARGTSSASSHDDVMRFRLCILTCACAPNFDDVTVFPTGRQVCGGGVRVEQHC